MPANPTMTLGTQPPKRFRVAFSFAGEQRVFVSKVAAILDQQLYPLPQC